MGERVCKRPWHQHAASLTLTLTACLCAVQLADPQMVRQPEWLNATLLALWPHISILGELLSSRRRAAMVGLHLPAAAAHIHSDTITLTCTTRAAAERLATRSHQLDELLNSSQVWRPRWLGSSRVVVQGVSLGHTPPRITAIKAVAQREGNYAVQRQLALDCAFAWSSDLEGK